jgi:hypothetical protein
VGAVEAELGRRDGKSNSEKRDLQVMIPIPSERERERSRKWVGRAVVVWGGNVERQRMEEKRRWTSRTAVKQIKRRRLIRWG